LSAPYVGLAANVTPGAAVSIQYPQDGDLVNSAALAALKTMADLLAAISLVASNKRTAVADAAYSVVAGDYVIAFTSLTASRVVTLPSAVGPVRFLYISDESGNASNTITLSVVAAAGQSFSGVANPTTKIVVNTPYGSAQLYSNGTNWFQLA
jgi:hypothetical protein